MRAMRILADNLPERIERAVRDWSQWSRAERRRMDDIVSEFLHFARTGEGNRFVREVWETWVRPRCGL